MSLYEYDEEQYLKCLREESREEGVEEGQEIKLISIILKKFKKGLSEDMIAEFLEDEVADVHQIIKVIQENQCMSEKEIFHKWKTEQKCILSL